MSSPNILTPDGAGALDTSKSRSKNPAKKVGGKSAKQKNKDGKSVYRKPKSGVSYDYQRGPRVSWNRKTLMFQKKDAKDAIKLHTEEAVAREPKRDVVWRTLEWLMKKEQAGKDYYYADLLRWRTDCLLPAIAPDGVNVKMAIELAQQAIVEAQEKAVELGFISPEINIKEIDRSPKSTRRREKKDSKKVIAMREALLAAGLTKKESDE